MSEYDRFRGSSKANAARLALEELILDGEERDAVLLNEAAKAVCMYCGGRVPGFDPAEGPNGAGNMVHYPKKRDPERPEYGVRLCAASSIHHPGMRSLIIENATGR